MTIGECLRRNDIDTYRKLMQIGRRQQKKIKLGDRPERFIQQMVTEDEGEELGRLSGDNVLNFKLVEK